MNATIYRHKKTGALIRVERRADCIRLTHADGRTEDVGHRFWVDHKRNSYRAILDRRPNR